MKTSSYSDYFPAGECCWPPCTVWRPGGRWTKGASLACDDHRPIYDPIRAYFDDVSPRMRELRVETGIAFERGAFNNGRQHCMTPGCSARRTHESEHCQKCLDEETHDIALIGY